MKKTLLASALLLAFAATAQAGTEGRYLFGEGETLVVNEQTTTLNRVLGGGRTYTDTTSGTVVVNTGNWDMVVGGSYISGSGNTEYAVGYESTSVTINSSVENKVTARHVVGGTSGSNVHRATSSETTSRTASLTINGGEYGQESDWSGVDTLESLIVGGDHFKNNASGGADQFDNTTDVYLKSTQTVIDNATVNALVIGGSLSNQYYPSVGSGVLKTHVGTANLTIKNSTINKPIIAGGAAIGVNAISNVDVANLTIENSTVNDRIYTGALVRYSDPTGTVEGRVGTTNLTVTNSTVKSIENGRAIAKYDDGKWNFIPEEGHYYHNEANDAETSVAFVNSSAETISITKGSVELRVEGANGKTTVSNLVLGDTTTVALTADGEANDAHGGDISGVITVVSGLENVKATVDIEEGLFTGGVTGTLENGVANVKVERVSSTMQNVLDLASTSTLSLNRIVLNDVRKRLGDLRASEGTHGVWARYNGGKLSGERGFENNFTTIQIGADTVPVADAPRFGVAFSYTTSDADMKRGGAEMDAFSLAFYGTKMYDNGLFVDVIGRMATADTDITVNVSGEKTGTMDNVALSLSGELGWRFDVTDKFYLEPQAELTYTYVNSDTLTLTGGNKFEFDSVDSLMGRVGFAAGFKCPNNFGDVYVRASAVHEFLGDSAVTGGNGNRLEVNGEDTWVEFGIGANFNVNKNTYVYADIERTEGAKLEEDWRANVGVRYTF